jgi:tubulin polyglutamylase TTLL6/13
MDVMLDQSGKPWLIEVNHSPSFMTDSPLDYSIKKNVLRDTLHMLNLSWKRKNKYLNQERNEKEKRLIDSSKKITSKQKLTEKESKKQKKIAQKDQFENSNMGDF